MVNSASRRPAFGKRHIFLLLGFLGYTIAHMQRHSFAITLRAMVNTSDLPPRRAGECGRNFSPVSLHSGELKWDPSFQRLLLNMYSWGTILPLVLVGTVAQRVGGKWFFLTGMLLRSVSFLVTPFLSWWRPLALLLSRFLEGFGDGVAFAALGAMLGRWSPREEVTLMSAVQVFGPSAGNFIATAITGYLVSWPQLGGWPEVFYLYAGVVILWVPLWIACVSNSPRHGGIGSAERHFIARSLGPTRQAEINKSQGVPWSRLLTDRTVLVLCVCSSGVRLAFVAFSDHVPQFLSDVLNVDIQDNILLFAIPYLIFIIASVVLSASADAVIVLRPNTKGLIRKSTTLVSSIGPAVGLLAVVAMACHADLILIVLLLSVFVLSLSNCGVRALPLDLSPEYSGTLFGLSATFSAITESLVQFVVGMIQDSSRRTWTFILVAEAVFVVASGFFVLAVGRLDRRQWTAHLEMKENDEDMFSQREREKEEEGRNIAIN